MIEPYIYWALLLSTAVGAGIALLTKRRKLPRIDPASPCPACGARCGKLKSVLVKQGAISKVMVRTECGECGGRWYRNTIVNSPNIEAAEIVGLVNTPGAVLGRTAKPEVVARRPQ